MGNKKYVPGKASAIVASIIAATSIGSVIGGRAIHQEVNKRSETLTDNYGLEETDNLYELRNELGKACDEGKITFEEFCEYDAQLDNYKCMNNLGGKLIKGGVDGFTIALPMYLQSFIAYAMWKKNRKPETIIDYADIEENQYAFAPAHNPYGLREKNFVQLNLVTKDGTDSEETSYRKTYDLIDEEDWKPVVQEFKQINFFGDESVESEAETESEEQDECVNYFRRKNGYYKIVKIEKCL